jgi:hypothetical protein
MVEEAKRRRVGPVQVVHEEGDRALVGEVVEQPVEAVRHREGAVGRRARAVLRPPEQRLGQRRGAAEEPLPPRPVGPRHDRLEELTHAAVGEVSLELAGPRPQAREPMGDRRVRRRPEKARLAEARRSLHEDHPAGTGLGVRQRVVELRELTLALQKCRRSLDGHGGAGVSEAWTTLSTAYVEDARVRGARLAGPRSPPPRGG